MVDLAALEITTKETEYLRKELNSQMEALDELTAIPIPDGTPIAAHGVPYAKAISAEIREDIWEAFPNPETILEQAPELENRYFVVPDIEHEDL